MKIMKQYAIDRDEAIKNLLSKHNMRIKTYKRPGNFLKR